MIMESKIVQLDEAVTRLGLTRAEAIAILQTLEKNVDILPQKTSIISDTNLEQRVFDLIKVFLIEEQLFQEGKDVVNFETTLDSLGLDENDCLDISDMIQDEFSVAAYDFIDEWKTLGDIVTAVCKLIKKE
jgi:acyl carrier protein